MTTVEASYDASMRTVRAFCSLVALFSLSLPLVSAAAEEAQSLAYEVWFGGLKALEADSRIMRHKESYRVTLSARTKGMVGWLYPYELELETVGARQSAEHSPRQFNSKSRSSDETKKLAIHYDEDGGIEVRREPASKNPDSKALPAEMTHETLDPVSAMLTVIASASRAASGDGCQGLARVYDGKRRYDLWARPAGTTTLKANSYNVYSGPATLCRLTLQPLAGFKKEKRLALRMPREITLWLAPIGNGGALLPVRLEGESSFGGLVAHLVGAKSEPQSARATRRPKRIGGR